MLIKVKIYPEAKQEKVVKKKEDTFEIFVEERPKQGKANQRILKMLAEYFKLQSSKIRLIKGAREK